MSRLGVAAGSCATRPRISAHTHTNHHTHTAHATADNLWGGDLPDASWLDAASGGRPALLQRMDSHMALANSAALKLAGAF